VIDVYDLSCVKDLGLDGKQALSLEEVPIELEQLDSADPPLAVHGLHVGRYRQHRRHSTEEVHEFDWTLSGDPARITVFHRSVPICAAVCRQMAQEADPTSGIPETDGSERKAEGRVINQQNPSERGLFLNASTSYDSRRP